MDCAAHIEIKRYRYQKDERNGRSQSYTEYEFYINYELKFRAVRGEIKNGKLFMSIHSFKTHCRLKFNEAVIDVFKPMYINLGFQNQRY